MKSMTGYGHTSINQKDLDLDVAVRSVNGRYLDIRLHLPREYLSFESEIKKIISSEMIRGTVDVFIQRRYFGASAESVNVNLHAAKEWLKALKELSQSSKVAFDLNLVQLSSLNGVVTYHDRSLVSAKEKKTFIATLKKAVNQCQKERLREGRALKIDMNNQLTQFSQTVTEMKKLRVAANTEIKKRFANKVKKWENLNYDPQRLSQELAIVLDKVDINEELARLSEHIKHCRSVLNGNSGRGKKLDFYSQELLREVNTIGSKSQLSKLTELVVDAKSLVERFREQVQNIE